MFDTIMEASNDIDISVLSAYVINNWYKNEETICQVDKLNFKSGIIEIFNFFCESFIPAASRSFFTAMFQWLKDIFFKKKYQANNVCYEIPVRLLKSQ